MAFDFEAFYKALIMVCCVAVTIAAVVSLFYLLRISKKEHTKGSCNNYCIYENTINRLADGMDNMNMVLGTIQDRDIELRDRIENLEKQIKQLEQKLNEVYIEE